MKKHLIAATALTLISSAALTTNVFAAKSPANMSELDKQSYAAGYAQGGQLHKMDTELGVKFSMDHFNKGFADGYKNKKPSLSEKQIEESLVSLQKSIMGKQQAYMKNLFEKNKKDGEAFLATKSKEPNVKKLENGVLYEEVKAGTATTKPTTADKVKVTYKGTTIDGKEFDKNSKVDLSLSNVIKGWQTALQQMTPGTTWKLYIPADQAYGERGAPGIMPNSTLIFEVTLDDIVANDGKKS